MSRARTLAGAIGSDGALNVADVAGLAAVASSGSASDLSTGTLPVARLATTSDFTINGLTVGKGAGAVSTNTAVGASALAANTTGASNTALGNNAFTSNTEGSSSTAVGSLALTSNTTGSANTGIGQNSLGNNISGSDNAAVGTASMLTNSTGVSNAALGRSALRLNTTGSYNTVIGMDALRSNTTASYNTAVGYQAGYSNTTGTNNALFGYQCGYSLTTGTFNTFIGQQAAYYVTTGSRNTVIGTYNGNQGGLDIRTASNRVVLSDGDGNPVFTYGAYPNGAGVMSLKEGYATLGLGGTGTTGTGALFLNGEATSGWGPAIQGATNGTGRWTIGSNSWVKGGTDYTTLTCLSGSSGGVNLTSGATSWVTASDERLKDIIEPISNGLNKVASLRAVIGKYKDDSEEKRRPFLIAQDVQAVLPEAVTELRNSKDDDTEYLQLSYTEVIPLLVAAIKELKAEIDTLKGQA